MTLDWNAFTPHTALAGGLLLGLASAGMILLCGRVVGISGMLGGLLAGAARGDRAWRLAFFAGLAASPWLMRAIAPEGLVRVPRFEAGPVLLVVAGLLVGYGTRMGSGCTSGHGVCGLSRMSPRSLAATACFMVPAFVVVYVVRHLLQGAAS
ncbi:MAG: hypothetical protein RL026_2281 [Pseudomonadota bacterium]|jgi:uncharacterized membrane protein YedE/YeeE